MNIPFLTVQYCKDNNIPCFTLDIEWDNTKNDKTLKTPQGWNKIDKPHIESGKHALGLLTGISFWVLDIDNIFESLPQNIQNLLFEKCNTIVKTRKGYHFYFKVCAVSNSLKTCSGTFFIDKKQSGADIRNKGGFIIAPPSIYCDNDMNVYKYKWVKGNLSTISTAPPEILDLLQDKDNQSVDYSHDTSSVTFDNNERDDNDIKQVLNGLAMTRVDNYSDWVTTGMALKNSGYDLTLWDEWSKLSSKYRPGICDKKWKSFIKKNNGVTTATLYQWLKQDNYPLFISLRSKNNLITDKLLSATNSGVAEAFYNINPDKYLVFDNEAYYLGDNNVWIKAKSVNNIPKIRITLQKDCLETLNTIEKNAREQNCSISETASQVSKFESSEKMKQIYRIKKKLESTSFLNSTVELLRDYYYKEGNPNDVFNSKINLFAFDNCVFDTDTLDFRNIQYDDYISVTCGYNYREATDDETELVVNFLKTIWPSNELLVYMLSAISSTFIGYNPDEFFHVLTGKGANGKSSIVDLCMKVFGKYAYDIPYTYITKKVEGISTPLPALVNAMYIRFLIVCEPDQNDCLQTPLIKKITGNDAFSGRTIYGEEQTFKPQYKLWICTNDIPKLSNYDQAIHRRMRIVPFSTRFCHNPKASNERLINVTLKKDIKTNDAWKYGFLNLLIEAFKRMNGQSLSMSKEVVEMTEKYMSKNNPVGFWLKTFYDITNKNDDKIPKCDLYEQFLKDIQTLDIDGFISQKKFTELLIDKNNIQEKTVRGKQYFWGLKRKVSEDKE